MTKKKNSRKMSIIHKLSPTLAQKIAAGEVVSRPESVVKELIENSLDAHAQTITIFIKQAGRTQIHEKRGDGVQAYRRYGIASGACQSARALRACERSRLCLRSSGAASAA